MQVAYFSPPSRTGEGPGAVGIEGPQGRLEGASHHGIVGMRERARLLGGRLRVTSRQGRGTAVSVRIPRGREDEG